MPNIPTPGSPQGRAGNGLTCANCSKPLVPERGSRRMRFCSGGCRQAGYRTRKWASRYEGPGPLRSVRNTLDGSGPYNGNFGDRGIRGPMFVVERELFAGLEWTPADFEDGATLEELKAMVEFHSGACCAHA